VSLTNDKIADLYASESGLLVPTAYAEARKTIEDRFGKRVWFLTDCCLSVYGAMYIKDIKNPVGLILVDAPSTEKTTVLNFFYPTEDESDPVNDLVYKTDSFTPKAFVSHAAQISKNQLSKVDLLPRIKNKILIVPELAPTFSKREEDLTELIGILTRVFDGEGLESDSGVHGRRGYRGRYFFTLMGATTPLERKVWKVMGKLGSRLIFLTVETKITPQEEQHILVNQLMSEEGYGSKVARCQEAVHNYMSALYRQHGRFDSIEWRQSNPEDEEWIRKVALIAGFVAKARSYVSVWKEGESYEYKIPVPERPIRLASILCNVARGHAILDGRTSLNASDMRVIYEIGMSSMPSDHRSVLVPLLESNDGIMTISEIEDELSVSPNTARQIMEKLTILGICEAEGGTHSHKYRILLKEEFGDLLSKEFRGFRYPKGDV